MGLSGSTPHRAGGDAGVTGRLIQLTHAAWTTLDPLVYERATLEREPWHPTGVRLSAFLVTIAAFEAIINADHCVTVSEITQATCVQLLRALKPLPVPGPTVNAQLYAGSGDVLAFADPNISGDQEPNASTTWWLRLAARCPANLQPAERILAHIRP